MHNFKSEKNQCRKMFLLDWKNLQLQLFPRFCFFDVNKCDHKFDETHFMLTCDGMTGTTSRLCIKHRPLHIKNSINLSVSLEIFPIIIHIINGKM